MTRLQRALATPVPAGWPRLLDAFVCMALVAVSLVGAASMAWALLTAEVGP